MTDPFQHRTRLIVISIPIREAFGYDLSTPLDAIRETYRFNVSCQGSVPQTIVAFLESTEFEDAVRNAISMGGDADTMADPVCGQYPGQMLARYTIYRGKRPSVEPFPNGIRKDTRKHTKHCLRPSERMVNEWAPRSPARDAACHVLPCLRPKCPKLAEILSISPPVRLPF
jgi:hypothetical protein